MNNNVKKQVIDKVNSLLKTNELTIREIALNIACNESYLGKILNGKRQLSDNVLAKLSKYLDTLHIDNLDNSKSTGLQPLKQDSIELHIRISIDNPEDIVQFLIAQLTNHFINSKN